MIAFLRRFRRAWNIASSRGGKMCCEECGGRIHRHDRYKILAAKHLDCSDPKLVGQTSMPAREDV